MLKLIHTYAVKMTRLIFGLFLYGLGTYLSIQAHIGLAPWDAFSMGIANLTGYSFGNVVVFTGLIILLISVVLKEKVGFGTIINTILIGKFVDLIHYFNVVPLITNAWLGIAVLLIGQITLCIGSYYYIGAGLGCGPRDSMMVALGKRMPKIPIGAVRAGLEGSVLFIGYLLGAKVGLGTLISVVGIGFILQYTFKLFHFQVIRVQHESIYDTLKRLKHTK